MGGLGNACFPLGLLELRIASLDTDNFGQSDVKPVRLHNFVMVQK